MRYFQQSKPHRLDSHAVHSFRAGGKDGNYSHVILYTEFQTLQALLIVTDGRPVLLVTWESRMKENLPSLICWLHFKSPAPTQRHTEFTTTEVQTPYVVCGQQTNNSLNQKHFRKQEELSVVSVCLSFPLITSQYTLTNRLMQETGNKGAWQASYWNTVSSRCNYNPVISTQPQSQANQEEWECHTPKKQSSKNGTLFVHLSHLKVSQINAD